MSSDGIAPLSLSEINNSIEVLNQNTFSICLNYLFKHLRPVAPTAVLPIVITIFSYILIYS
jgi:hypothetical protein